MSNTTLSPNMNMAVPVVGVDPGPDWANNINADLSIIDQHDHSAGQGVQVNPSGLNINSDLTFQSNNATSLRSSRYSPQTLALSLPADVGCLYVVNNELYYNDVTGGHQIQITSNGSVNAGSGSIGGLPSGSASATFSGGTFVWQSATSTAANMDFGSAILRDSGANSKGLTLQPPAAMAANYSLTLPPLPAQQNFMTLDASGNMTAPWNLDNTTIQVSSNNLQVIAAGLVDGVSTTASANQIQVRNTMFYFDFNLNGNYGNLSGSSLLQLDGLRFFNFNATIVNVYAWIRGAGSGGTTTLDLKLATTPSGSYTTIFSTKPAFASTAAASSYVDSNGVVTPGTGVTAGVLSTTSVNAGSALKFDLTGVMTNPDSCGLTIIFKQR